MIVAHFSDTHSLPRKPVPASATLVVHTGDLLPNRTRGNISVEVPYQSDWIRKTAAAWAHWLGGRRMLIVAGNHDFIDVAPFMRAADMRVRNVFTDGPQTVDGVRFAGVPYIPTMAGEWNHEKSEQEISDGFRRRVLAHKPHVILNHCPIAGVLDHAYGHGIGSVAMANALWYERGGDGDGYAPLAYLHGHNHEQAGSLVEINGILFSNAATTRNLIEVTTEHARVKGHRGIDRVEPRVRE